MKELNNPTDEDFFYIGFTARQVFMLQGQSESIRQAVYEEGLRLLMENGPGYDGGHAVHP